MKINRALGAALPQRKIKRNYHAMKIISAIFFILISFFLQSSVFEYLRIGGIIPNIVLIVFVFIIMMADSQEIFAAALVGGLLLDFSSSFLFGVFTLSFIVIGFALAKAKHYLFAKANFIVFLLAVSLATFFYYLFAIASNEIAFLLKIPVGVFSVKNILIVSLPREILYNLAVAAVIFGFLKTMEKLFLKSKYLNGSRPNF